MCVFLCVHVICNTNSYLEKSLPSLCTLSTLVATYLDLVATYLFISSMCICLCESYKIHTWRSHHHHHAPWVPGHFPGFGCHLPVHPWYFYIYMHLSNIFVRDKLWNQQQLKMNSINGHMDYCLKLLWLLYYTSSSCKELGEISWF